MALTRFNYQPGQYETCTDETLIPASPVLNTWYNFEIGDWKHAISDVVLKQSGVAIPTSAYELAIDTKYTAREVGESDKTIYAKWRIVNATYDEIATTVSGNNFGTYIDNAKTDSRLDALEAFDAALDAGEVPYDNSSSGLAATDVQAAIDEIQGDASKIDYDNATSGLAATDVKGAIDELESLIPAVHTNARAFLASDQNVTTEATVLVAGTGFSSGVYTVPSDGIYLVIYGTNVTGGSNGDTSTMKIKDGSTVVAQSLITVQNATRFAQHLSYCGAFSASDTISVTATRGGGGTLVVEGNGSVPYTYIDIIKLT